MLGALSIHFGQTFQLRPTLRSVLRWTSRFDSVPLNVFGYVVPPGVETSCPLICSTAFVQQMGKKFLNIRMQWCYGTGPKKKDSKGDKTV